MIKKILVTGSSGTIGTRLCEVLIELGYDITGVDLKENKWHKYINDITILCDLRNKKDVLELPNKNYDLVIHLAANARVFNLVKDPSMARDNFEILFNTLEFAREKGIKKFIFASSREVYGNTQKIIHSEDESFIKNCESTYTASKIGGEALVHSYQQCYGIDFFILRFSNVFGMYDDKDRLVPLYINLAKKGEPLQVYGADKILDFTYIDDAISGIIKCIENFEKAKNEVFNLSHGEGSSIIIRKQTGSSSEIKIESNRTGEIVKYIADISKAKKLLGYESNTSLEEGLKKTVDWYSKFYSN